MNKNEDRTPYYHKDSLTLVGAVALGTGVMIAVEGDKYELLATLWRSC